MNYHCESCDGTSMVRDEDGNFKSCPGCPDCAEKDKALQVADEMAELVSNLSTFGQTNAGYMKDLVQRYQAARKRRED